MKKFNLLALLMVVIFTFFAGCGSITDNVATSSREEIEMHFPSFTPSMEEREYVHLEKQEGINMINEIVNLSEKDGNFDKIIEVRDQLLMYTAYIGLMSQIASLSFDNDVTSEYFYQEAQYSKAIYQELFYERLELDQQIFASPLYKDMFVAKYGEDYCNSILQASTESPENLALLNEISNLEAQYATAYQNEDFSAIATIYKQLIIKRNQYAKKQKDSNGEFYKNYFDYTYEAVYNREYTPDDTIEFKNACIENLKPLAYKLVNNIPEDYKHNSDCYMSEIVELVEYVIPQIVPEMRQSLDYLMYKNLYDFEISPTKAQSDYVTTLDLFDDGFMFLSPSGTLLSDLKTFIHEFGHYNEIYMSDPEKTTNYYSNDLAETHSQCYELLTIDPLKEVLTNNYNEKIYNSYTRYVIFSMIWSILSNCMFDQFEFICYNADPETLNEEFFNKTMDDLWKKYWVTDKSYKYYDISHFFSVPGYCISYSVSATFSAEIYASENPIENYITAVQYGCNNKLSTVYKAVNLESPIKASSVKTVGDKFKNLIKEKLPLYNLEVA